MFFFSAHFWSEFCFFFPGKVYMHSLTHLKKLFFFPAPEKKKRLFYSLTRFWRKIPKKQTFPGKKKRYLWIRCGGLKKPVKKNVRSYKTEMYSTLKPKEPLSRVKGNSPFGSKMFTLEKWAEKYMLFNSTYKFRQFTNPALWHIHMKAS